MKQGIVVLTACAFVLASSLAASYAQGPPYTHCEVNYYTPTGGGAPTAVCVDPCDNDVCEFWDGAAGESCRCENTLQVNCCDLCV